MEEYVEKLYKFVQENYLWQFYSRNWDREKNINGILGAAEEILATGKSTLGDSLEEKFYYSEAVTVVNDLKAKLDFISGLNETGLKDLFEKTKEKLIDVTITKSLNGELNIQYY